MVSPVSVRKFEAKSHDSPDETRTPNKTRLEIVRLDGFSIGRMILEPGWRWSECIKPVVGTDMCQVSHVGHLISGRLVIELTDGTKHSIGPGESYVIPPGHEAWTEGSEPTVAIEVLSAEQFARPDV